MLNQVDAIGKAIRYAYRNVVSDKFPIYLVMDNAGGHGTVEAKQTFVERLEMVYNVRVNWQVPNSPDTNMLDLGVWMTIQSKVEELHRTLVLDNDVLAKTVIEAFETFDSDKLTNIYERWEKVLDLIIKNEGRNDLVEHCCGDESPDHIPTFVSFDNQKHPVDMRQIIDDVYQQTDSECSEMEDSDNKSDDSDSIAYSAYSVSSASTEYSIQSNNSDDSSASSVVAIATAVAHSSMSGAGVSSVASAFAASSLSTTSSKSKSSSASSASSACSASSAASADSDSNSASIHSDNKDLSE